MVFTQSNIGQEELLSEQLSEWLGSKSFSEVKAEYDQNGYYIFRNVLSAEKTSALCETLEPYFEASKLGRNDFEGLSTNRVYALLAKGAVFAELATHPLALAFAEADLGPSCLLSACLAIRLYPGETVQPWHYDDGHIMVPRPRPSWGVSCFWALDDTTEDNGATELLPGSHEWPDNFIKGSAELATFGDAVARDVADDPGARIDSIKATMPAGSLMVMKGTTWHRGGANKSDKPRLIITPQYCPGWARPLETMLTAIPKDVVISLSERARELIGYSIHPPFMGYADGMHPKRLLL